MQSSQEVEKKFMRIDDLGRFSAVAVCVFSVITLGLYSVYWLASRSIKLNTIQKDNVISVKFIVVVIVVLLAAFVVRFFGNVFPPFPYSAYVFDYFLYFASSLFVVWQIVFLFKLNEFVYDSSYFKLASLVFALLFGVVYLSYKINQYIDYSKDEKDICFLT